MTVTDHEDYTVTLNYDAIGGVAHKTLDRVVKTTFPDGTTSQTIYDELGLQAGQLTDAPLDAVKTIDRRGRATRYVYDAMRNVTKITDPELRVTMFTHCTCGALEGVIDGELRVTEWERKAQ